MTIIIRPDSNKNKAGLMFDFEEENETPLPSLQTQTCSGFKEGLDLFPDDRDL